LCLGVCRSPLSGVSAVTGLGTPKLFLCPWLLFVFLSRPQAPSDLLISRRTTKVGVWYSPIPSLHRPGAIAWRSPHDSPFTSAGSLNEHPRTASVALSFTDRPRFFRFTKNLFSLPSSPRTPCAPLLFCDPHPPPPGPPLHWFRILVVKCDPLPMLYSPALFCSKPIRDQDRPAMRRCLFSDTCSSPQKDPPWKNCFSSFVASSHCDSDPPELF